MKKETLDLLHQKQVELLDVIDAFCEQNNLKYFLIGGTLLGAIRHKGFIPWDDDVDVAMPRKDYEYLCKNISEYLGDKYFLQTSYTDKAYGRYFAKIRINNTVFLEEADCTVEKRHHGIFLDIFPLDESREKASKFVSFKRMIARYVDSYIVCKRGNIKIRGKAKVFYVFPIKFLIKLRDRLTRGKGNSYFVNFLGDTPKDKFEPLVRVEFEGKEYLAPKEYDYLLTKMYGDYMQLPPVDQRVTHNPVRISFDLNGKDAEM